MAKRVLEFNCGDPKTNQQTASKVDSNINITNINHIVDPSKMKGYSGRRGLPEDDDDGAVFNGENELEDIESKQSAGAANGDGTANLQVKVAVNRDVTPQQPTKSERFVVTARNLPVLREEILQSMNAKDTLIGILTNMLAHEDTQLIMNVLDRSGKIILTGTDFSTLVAAVLSSNGTTVKPSDVKLRYNEDIITSCFKSKISPFKHIVAVQVGDQDLRLHQYEAYNTITNDFSVSTETIYVPDRFE